MSFSSSSVLSLLDTAVMWTRPQRSFVVFLKLVQLLAAIISTSAVASGESHSPASARELPGHAQVARIRACPESVPDDYATLPERSDGDEDDDEDEDVADVGPGLTIDAGDCIFPSLEITTGNQSALIGGRLGKMLGPSARTPISGQLNATLGLTHVNYAWAGGLVTTISIVGSKELSLSQASIHSRYFGFGLMGSRFDGWSGDEFSFRAIAPSQSPMLASVVPWRTDTAIFALSAEDPSFRRITVSGYGAYRVPDLVARWAWRLGHLDFTLSAATHETTLSLGGGFRGYAGLASLRVNLPAVGKGSYLVLQGSAADKALGFLGIHTASNAFGFNLPGSLNAATAEAGKGIAGAIVGFWQYSDEVSYAGYLTGTRLALPGPEGGRITSWRTAANVTWTPVDGLAFALEAGYAQVDSGVLFVPSGNAKTILITMTRTAM